MMISGTIRTRPPRVSYLLICVIAGLAGCGGGTTVNDPAFTPIAAPPLNAVTVTQAATAAVQPGQSAIIETPALGSGTTGGITRVTVALPEGALLQESTLGVSVLAFDENTLERIRRADPQTVSQLTSVAEIIFGRVVTGSNATSLQSAAQLLSTGERFAPRYTLRLTEEQSVNLDTLISTPGATYEFVALVRDESSFNQRLIRPQDCQVAYDTANNLITVEGCRAYDLIVAVLRRPT